MTNRTRALPRLPFLGLFLFLCAPGLVLAGPNEGGTLVIHANPSLVFTSDIQDYCGMSALDSCSAAVTSVDWDPGKEIVFHVLAAFPPESSPRLKALSFGIDFDSTKFVIAARHTCADFEISDGRWPAPGTGTSQSWTTGVQTGLLTEVYWFAGYAYSEQEGEGSTSVALIPHPVQQGVFVDDAFPAEVDTIAGYGRLGLGTPGSATCPVPHGGSDGEGDVGVPTFPQEPDGEGESLARRVSVPSTDVTPFHKVHLYNDVLTATCSVEGGDALYPSFLQEDTLLIVRDYQDTIAVCHSFAVNPRSLAYDSVDCPPAPSPFVRFGISPPQYATSLFLCAMPYDLYADQGGDSVLTVKTSDPDGHSVIETLRAGERIRNQLSYLCYWDPWRMYTSHPTDPLCGEVWSGPWQDWPADTLFYDVQELALPPTWRTRRVSEVEIDLLPNSETVCNYCCGGGEKSCCTMHTGVNIYGLSLGEKFEMANGQGHTVVTQKQTDSTWASTAYGGYWHDGVPVGTWSTIGRKGCYLTCCAMAHVFYGQSCTPLALNLWLQEHKGFARHRCVSVTEVHGQDVGDTVTVTITSEKFSAGDRLLIEHGAYDNPVATIECLEGCTEGDTGVLTRIAQLHGSPDTLQVGDRGYVFNLPLRDEVSAFGGHEYTLVGVSGGGTVAQTEHALRESAPVLVHTRVVNGASNHFVLATGMRPKFAHTGKLHRGTYGIHDPGYSTDDLLDAYKPGLSYENKFTDAQIALPTDAQQRDAGDQRLLISLYGPAVLQVTDPSDQRIVWDSDAFEYDSGIDGATAIHEWRLDDIEDSTLAAPAIEVVGLVQAQDGDYLIEVVGMASGGFSLQVGGYDADNGYSSADIAEQAEEGGSLFYRVSYSSTPGSQVSVEQVPDPAAVGEPVTSGASRLLVSPVPTGRGASVSLFLASAGPVELDLFDVRGAEVARLGSASMSAGEHRLEWDGTDRGGRLVPAGVYFLRGRVAGLSMVRRLVVIK